MKVSDYIALFLEEQSVPCVYEMSGGMITHLLDSIHHRPNVRIVSVHHEQTAAFAAEAAGRLTGIPGVAMATSGPGATNLITGIGSCFFDSTPAVFITGQVNRNEQRGEKAIRQLGFQETDIVSVVKPVTKAAWSVNDPEEVPAMLRRAFQVATEGRPGPVLLDIPMDVQRADIQVESNQSVAAQNGHAAIGVYKNGALPKEDSTAMQAYLANLKNALQKVKRPLILAGGGIRSARVTDLFRSLVEQLQIPVVHSLMAVDILPFDNPLRAGFLGSYGNRWTNLAIGRSDFLLVLGSRLDVRQTGAQTEAFKGEREVFHVDVEPGEMNNRVTGCHTMQAHLREFFEVALHFEKWDANDYSAWLDEIHALREQWPDTGELPDTPGINPNAILHQISGAENEAAAYCVDVGQHQMWAAQSLELGPDQRFLTSGGMGSMGFGLPAAVGAATVSQGKPVVMIAGDGSFQTNIQELETIARNRLPVKLIIINNQCHGMVRQFQESYFDARYQSTLWGYSAPDFERVAQAYNIAARTVSEPDDVQSAVEWLWSDPTAPMLLQVMVDTYANAYPKIAFGHAMTEMEPFATPIEMEST